MKESDLAIRIIDELESKGYECYKEVLMKGKGGNKRCDCYFVKKKNGKIIETIAVEVKLNMNLTVLNQSDLWSNYANLNYICVPSSNKKTYKLKRFALKICKLLNIGMYEVYSDYIKESYTPEFKDKYTLPPLYEEQKEGIAGSTKEKVFTSFKNTVNQINDYMIDKKVCDLDIMLSEIKHHYKNNSSAKNSIKKHINKNIIEGFTVEGNNINRI